MNDSAIDYNNIDYNKLIGELKLHAIGAFGSNEVTASMALSYVAALEPVQQFLKDKGIKNPQAFVNIRNKMARDECTEIALDDYKIAPDDYKESPDHENLQVATHDLLKDRKTYLDNAKPVVLSGSLNAILTDFFTLQEMNEKPVTAVKLFKAIAEPYLSHNLFDAMFNQKSEGRSMGTPTRGKPTLKRKRPQTPQADENEA